MTNQYWEKKKTMSMSRISPRKANQNVIHKLYNLVMWCGICKWRKCGKREAIQMLDNLVEEVDTLVQVLHRILLYEHFTWKEKYIIHIDGCIMDRVNGQTLFLKCCNYARLLKNVWVVPSFEVPWIQANTFIICTVYTLTLFNMCSLSFIVIWIHYLLRFC